MQHETSSLVVNSKRILLPAALAGSVALGAVCFASHTGVHASEITSAPLDDRSVSALTSLDQAMEAVASRVTPAVVNIAVTSSPSAEETARQGGGNEEQGGSAPQGLPPGFAQFFGPGGPFAGQGQQGGRRMQVPQQQQQLEHGIGSGVLISADGYIVTNNHVVDGAKDIKVTLNDRRIFNARVIGVDKLTDIAVIKIAGNDLPHMSWGDSGKLEPGQTVLAFGSPFGYFKFSVTRGIVSAINRANPYSDDARKPGGYIQTDAAINPGNSGGALVDAHGELIGINTWIISNSGSFSGAGFAIPAQIARSTAEQLIAHGKVDHGYVGISMNEVTPANAHFFSLPDASGAIVAEVTPNSPAARAGLQQGDVIRQLNGHNILDMSELQVQVSETAPGTAIALGVMRNGSPTTLHLTVGAFDPKNQQVAANDAAPGQPQTGKLGLGVTDLTPDVRQQLNLPDNLAGTVVQSVRPASPAEDAGLQPGDVILQVNRKPTSSSNQFLGAVHASPADQDILILVWSRGNASYRTLHPADQNG